MTPLSVAIIATLVLGSLCQTCSEKYQRFTFRHTLCLPRNTSCQIVKSQMTNEMKMDVLDFHNRYRNYIALGKETKAGGMKKASNMMQMVWDNELAAVVLKHLEQCKNEPDCSECRQVENFFVGQNIFFEHATFTTAPPEVPDFFKVIQQFYSQVENFDSKNVNSFSNYVRPTAPDPIKNYEHFTQLIWANTWRVGCDYVIYRAAGGYDTLVGCNYGPAGNIVGQPVYLEGDDFQCPENTCFGEKCSPYAGLCKMTNENVAPRYKTPENALMYCDFRDAANNCARVFQGRQWTFNMNAVGGPFAEIVLNPGETSTIDFQYTTKPTDIMDGYCFVIEYRTGPHLAGLRFDNQLVVNFKSSSDTNSITLDKREGREYYRQVIHRRYQREVKVSLTFSIPRAAPQQYANVRLVYIFDGKCS